MLCQLLVKSSRMKRVSLVREVIARASLEILVDCFTQLSVSAFIEKYNQWFWKIKCLELLAEVEN